MAEPDVNQPAGPYATAAPLYHRAGWAPLPIPFARKKPVPDGWTGNDGAWPSFADVQAWVDGSGGGNVALRMPPHVLGVDVDNYGAKPGGAVLAQLEERHSALPPTWRSTSRDDGVSGIRFYRIPEGLRWPGILGPGIETIRFAHRYAVAWPSVHPDTGGTYRWIGPDGVVQLGGPNASVPAVDELPALPQAWVDALTGGALASDQARADLGRQEVNSWLYGHEQGPRCRVMQRVLDRGIADLTTSGSRHEAGLALSNRLAWLAGEGHTGGSTALALAGRAFEKATADRVEPGEWDRMVDGAVKMAAAAHPTQQPDPCADPWAALRGLVPNLKGSESWQLSTTSPTVPTSAPSSPSPAGSTYSSAPVPAGPAPATSPTAAAASTSTDTEPTEPTYEPPRELVARLQLGGAFILDQPDRIPAVWGDGDAVLWAEGEALTICGPAGVGKTTLTGQILRARLVGGTVLGLPVQPTGSRVLYLAMDRPRQIARALRRTLGDLPRDVLDAKLVIWPGPPIADVAAHPETLVGLVQLAGADTVIVDSIKDAAVGLSSDEVGAGYNRARQMCIAEGIEVLEQHHMVKKGEKGAKPNSLADLYGSVWIGAGAGSVLLLYGAAGDPIVEMLHLKTPAEEVGPYRLRHDHDAGRTEIFHSTDALLSAQLAGKRGITAKALACTVAEKENPTESEVEKARRQLERLERQGLLRSVAGHRGGPAATWFYLDPLEGVIPEPVDNLWKSNHGSNHAPSPAEGNHAAGPKSRSTASSQVSQITDQITQITDAQITDAPSSLEEGGHPGEVIPSTHSNRVVRRAVAGQEVLVNLDTGEVHDPEGEQ